MENIEPETIKLMKELDVEVKKLVDLFRLILKYKIIFRGKGLDFYGLRQYQEGDDASLIDWKATVRMAVGGTIDKIYVKVFREERDLDVIVLVDASSTMLFGTGKRLKSEYASFLAGALCYAALESGDRCGLVMFSDKINKFAPPSKDSSQYYRVLKILVDKKNWGGKKNLAESLDFCVKLFNDKTFLFIISDFISVGKGWEDKLKMASAKFEGVLGMMIRDERDIVLPKNVGYYRFKDPFTGKTMTINVDKYADEFEKKSKEQMETVKKMFLSSNAGFISYICDDLFTTPLIRWLENWAAGR